MSHPLFKNYQPNSVRKIIDGLDFNNSKLFNILKNIQMSYVRIY